MSDEILVVAILFAALAKTPGPLLKRRTQAGNDRWVNVFRLPEVQK